MVSFGIAPCCDCGEPTEMHDWNFGRCDDCIVQGETERRQRNQAFKEEEAARVAAALDRCTVVTVNGAGQKSRGFAWVEANPSEHRCPDETWGSGRRHCLHCTYPYCDCGEHHATITSQRGAPKGMHGAVYQCHRCGARFPVIYPSAAYGALQRVRHNRVDD